MHGAGSTELAEVVYITYIQAWPYMQCAWQGLPFTSLCLIHMQSHVKANLDFRSTCSQPNIVEMAFVCEVAMTTYIHIYIYIYILLRGVENRRDIFFMYITGCVSFARIIPRRRIKLEKEAPNELFLITHDSRLKEEERKKKDDDRKWNCKSTPFHFLPILASLELWVTLSTTCSALRVKEGLLVFDWKSDYSSSGFDFEAATFIPGLCFTTPEMWLRKRTAEN